MKMQCIPSALRILSAVAAVVVTAIAIFVFRREQLTSKQVNIATRNERHLLRDFTRPITPDHTMLL
jgi:hypothetical protein